MRFEGKIFEQEIFTKKDCDLLAQHDWTCAHDDNEHTDFETEKDIGDGLCLVITANCDWRSEEIDFCLMINQGNGHEEIVGTNSQGTNTFANGEDIRRFREQTKMSIFTKFSSDWAELESRVRTFANIIRYSSAEGISLNNIAAAGTASHSFYF